jgi:hypothetical protein
MRSTKLIFLSLIAILLSLNSCGRASEAPSQPTAIATKSETTATAPAIVEKPVTSPVDKPAVKSKSATGTKPVASKAIKESPSTEKTTVVKTEPSPVTPPGTTLPSNTKTPMGTTATTPSTSTKTTSTSPPVSATGKPRMGSENPPASSPTSTQQPQTSPSGKPGMGTGTSGTSTNTQTNTGTNGLANFTQSEAASAIKEALMKGVTAGVSKVSVTDGYFKNGMIKIPFPQDAKVVETTLRQIGMGSLIDNLVLSLNRAAESAANQAGPIFINGIKQMSLNDAINIVSNKQPDAATQFLQRTTTESLVSAFKPPIQVALDKTLATKYWKDIMTNYNKIPFVKKVNTDLNDFVTRKAISGLFYMIGQEEAKIRKDPLGQGSKIIETVFGGVLKR